MKINNDPPLHLTYCLNIHKGETWEENFQAIRTKACAVRDIIAPGNPFGLGLRLSFQAASELNDHDKLEQFKQFLQQENLYVFTINGFPYGAFHQVRVKEDVYRPDWRTRERREYTILLADILSELLPEGISGSISTVPCSYGAWIKGPDDVKEMVHNLQDTAVYLNEIYMGKGKEISVALEPEPDCFIETTSGLVKFFREELLKADPGAEEIIRRHLGVCFDTAHMAVEFEDPAESLKQIISSGIKISKVHLSSALRLKPEPQQLERLKDFLEPVYLHQVKAMRRDGSIESFPDLPQAFSAASRKEHKEWRVHFHVPLFFRECKGLESTSFLLERDFVDVIMKGASEHLEIETYTFNVLPDVLKSDEVTESISKEFKWILNLLKSRTTKTIRTKRGK